METQEWYFAIGSMINPISLRNRGVVPLKSKPGRLLGYRLQCAALQGMAGCVVDKGSYVQGVAHLVTRRDMEKLDKAEGDSYLREKGRCEFRDERTINVTAYVWDSDKVNLSIQTDPTERYIQIISEGCKHHGVDPEYIEWLNSLPQQPRKKIEECRLIEIPDNLPKMTKDQIQSEENVVTLNGKVLRYEGNNAGSDYIMINLVQAGIVCVEIYLSKTVFDPMYGIVANENDAMRLHAAQMEDTVVSFLPTLGKGDWKLIATFEQIYKD